MLVGSYTKLLFLFICCLHAVLGIKWLSAAISEQKEWSRPFCSDKKFHFSVKQKGLCRKHTDLMKYVSESAQQAKTECQEQFRNTKWNCFGVTQAPHYGFDLTNNTKELAVVEAISAASLAITITRNCVSGSIANCECTEKIENAGEQFKSDVILFSRSCPSSINIGVEFAKEFTDAGTKKMKKVAKKNPLRAVHMKIQQHNRMVGWKVVETMKTTKCTCHGQTGNCPVKTCYKSLPSFQNIAAELKIRYTEATRVLIDTNNQQYAPASNVNEEVSDEELIYSDRSVNTCRNANQLVSMKGRYCSLEDGAENHCKTLCCGGRYEKTKVWVVEKCNCKFQWCCKVVCDSCNYQKEKYVCS